MQVAAGGAEFLVKPTVHFHQNRGLACEGVPHLVFTPVAVDATTVHCSPGPCTTCITTALPRSACPPPLAVAHKGTVPWVPASPGLGRAPSEPQAEPEPPSAPVMPVVEAIQPREHLHFQPQQLQQHTARVVASPLPRSPGRGWVDDAQVLVSLHDKVSQPVGTCGTCSTNLSGTCNSSTLTSALPSATASIAAPSSPVGMSTSWLEQQQRGLASPRNGRTLPVAEAMAVARHGQANNLRVMVVDPSRTSAPPRARPTTTVRHQVILPPPDVVRRVSAPRLVARTRGSTPVPKWPHVREDDVPTPEPSKLEEHLPDFGCPETRMEMQAAEDDLASTTQGGQTLELCPPSEEGDTSVEEQKPQLTRVMALAQAVTGPHAKEASREFEETLGDCAKALGRIVEAHDAASKLADKACEAMRRRRRLSGPQGPGPGRAATTKATPRSRLPAEEAMAMERRAMAQLRRAKAGVRRAEAELLNLGGLPELLAAAAACDSLDAGAGLQPALRKPSKAVSTDGGF